MSKKKNSFPTRTEVIKYRMLDALLDSIYTEMKEFSKKKPDEPLNKFKVKTLNRVLEQVKDLQKNEPTIEFLDLLDDETLPTNSDAILIISQFTAAMSRFRSKYHYGSSGKWRTNEEPEGEYV